MLRQANEQQASHQLLIDGKINDPDEHASVVGDKFNDGVIYAEDTMASTL
jgi:hypothetical protein